ncbi:hypothetical protein AWZ03_006533 [Drosophila navojoa]|uniref:Testis-expressed sequence 9 protein n=1 Tax=Drosophila navojoa TaxID=7232 RepID=A0A484BE20_DRONA|nr:putative uncharacterized protein DDB_G0271606 [Drosophila navojoa]XP_030240227.1 putative uncharacterized protein DDB_G0271606 [Drosophila navojoa]TDG47096.1 hypothetical protein AWZ03_006533 [Drosophila navojoa]
MAEILSREKELFHINQELNMMALNHPIDNGSQVTSQSRYCTYLKQKGPSTLLKKKLHANVNIDGAINNRHTAGRGHRSKVSRSPNKSAPTTPTPPSTQMTTPRGKQTTNLVSQLNKAKMPDWRGGRAHGRHATAPAASAAATNLSTAAAAAGRIDSTFTRRATHKTATFVKYRNPNFKASPSLDLLLRNADGAFEQQQSQQSQQPQQPQQPQQQQQQQQQEQQPLVELELVHQSRESTTIISGQSKKQLTQDNFIKFLKAKVAILEEDHGQLTQDMADQKMQLEQTFEALRKAEAQRDQAINTNAKLSEQLHRLELQTEEANRRHKDRQSEYNNLQHELELLRRDTKLLKQTNANLENRLMRANDETEATRQMLSQQATQQREDLDYSRKELKMRDTRIKALKRQRADLLNAYKKQLFMIDNLKRQNSCVEQAVAIGFGEKEFNKVLEWNTGTKTVF